MRNAANVLAPTAIFLPAGTFLYWWPNAGSAWMAEVGHARSHSLDAQMKATLRVLRYVDKIKSASTLSVRSRILLN